MDMGGGHHHMGAMAPAPFPPGGAHGGGMGMRRKRYIHMTFYWGQELGDPLHAVARRGRRHFLGSRRLDSLLPTAAAGANKRVAAGAARAAVHALRMGGAYLLMLALMSFNGGVLLVAVAGHAAGFLAFRAGLCGHGRAQVEGGCNKEEHAPAACC
ncbi:hypothetical protein SETIT_5G333200v2 [Setaria italica]|uniref:Copper transport protein n=1 Tax=Setaria italica TaxID=4555 RepID=K3XSN9_SETIT|nr:hypothetical protein SETIT_5G333200v2 [Setaria italica]